MGSQLHKDVSLIANDKPAIHIAHSVLAKLIVRRLVDALHRFKGQYIRYPLETGRVQIGLAGDTFYAGSVVDWITVVPDPTGSVFIVQSNPTPPKVDLFEVVIHVTAFEEPKKSLFAVVIQVQGIQVTGTISNQVLAIRNADLSLKTTVVKTKGSDETRKELGLSELEVARLEGLVDGSVAPTLMRNIFAGAAPIPLRSIFPAVVFDGQVNLSVVDNGLLVVARDGWHLDDSARCPCAASAPSIEVSPGNATENSPSTPSAPPSFLVPINSSSPNPRTPQWPVEDDRRPSIALYLPRKNVEAITGGPYPAVAGSASDNGFIGWGFDYTVAFVDTDVSLVDPRATIVLTLGFYVTGAGTVTVDVPCVGRQDVGIINANNRKEGPSTFKIGITPRLQPDGKIVLVPEILDLQIEQFEVHSYVIAASLLAFFGPSGDLAAFVIQVVVHEVIRENLPVKLREAIRDAMGKQIWTLVDLTKIDIRRMLNSVKIDSAVSREPESLLVGIQAGPD